MILAEHLADLDALHREVDERACWLTAHHRADLRCGPGCSDCCTDDFTVFEIEAEKIRARHPDLFAHEAPHPAGRCALLDAAGACRAYASRPYICRTQGLPLRWIEETPGGDLAEHRDVCPLNCARLSLLALEEHELWLIGPFESRLVELQTRSSPGSHHRVSLRSLFPASSRSATLGPCARP